MKAFLMHRDRDVDLGAELPPLADDVTQDLELQRTLDAMAGGDEFLLEIARRGVLSSLTGVDAIEYRQDILRDCLAHPDVVRELYGLALEALHRERRDYFSLASTSPDSILHRSVSVLELFAEIFARLRTLADAHASGFRSAGFTRLFAMFHDELDDDYLESVDAHLKELRLRHGVLIGARLGNGNKGTGFVLRHSRERGWWERLSLPDRSALSYRVADRDQAGLDALSDLRGRGVNLVANALAQSNDHIKAFFTLLRAELGFYVAALNLHERLTERGRTTCIPTAVAVTEPAFSCRGLYDVSLALSTDEDVVGNDVDADGHPLIVITGANHGGKSTFLRSAGLAQLMLQAGLFVGADALAADVRDGIYTHFRREEDASMRSGKLDEELRRMSNILGHMGPRGLLLCNESFASTNEREGSEIARQLIRALLEQGVKVLLVTHMYDLSHGLYRAGAERATFLLAPREDDGARSYRLVEGEPLPTGYGEDLYRRIFGTLPDEAATVS